MTLPPDARPTYNPLDPPVDEHRARKHRLVRELKRAIEHTALLDVGGSDAAELDALADRAEALADHLEARPRFHGLADLPMPDASLVERSGFSGRSNPLAPPVSVEVGADGVTRGSAVWTAAYEGPVGCLHGGYVAAAFDDLMGVAQVAAGIAGYTGTLTVRMVNPTPLHVRIDYQAAVDRVEGRKIYVRGTAHHGDTLLAECEIVFIAPRGGVVEAQLAEEGRPA